MKCFRTPSVFLAIISLQAASAPPTSGYVPPAGAVGLAGAYTNPAYLTGVPFGANSQWIQPWRAYLQTQPAGRFVDGVGVNFSTHNPELVAHMLAKYGFSRVRIEIGWGALDYQTESKIDPAAIAPVQAAKKWKLRPIIVINSNGGAPCPNLGYYHAATTAAAAGATTLQLDDEQPRCRIQRS